MSISRRGALIGASAAAAVAGVPGAAQGEDAVLLAQVARFHELYGEWQRVWAKQAEHRARIKAMPDCPKLDCTVEGYQAYFAFLEAHDAYGDGVELNSLADLAGALGNAIIETPAQTLKGAVEKLKIARIAVGSYGCPDDGDEALEAYHDWERPWLETVAKDFDRLLAGMRP